MDLVDLFWNLRQQGQIGGATTKATSAVSDAKVQEAMLADVTSRLERLTLVTQAMWELLSEHTNVIASDLLAKMKEVDMRDGTKDSRVVADRLCQKCGHAVGGPRATCLYCGAPIDAANPFAGL